MSELKETLAEMIRLGNAADSAADELHRALTKLSESDPVRLRREMIRAGVDPTLADHKTHRLRQFLTATADYFGKMSAELDCLRDQMGSSLGEVELVEREQRRAFGR